MWNRFANFVGLLLILTASCTQPNRSESIGATTSEVLPSSDSIATPIESSVTVLATASPTATIQTAVPIPTAPMRGPVVIPSNDIVVPNQTVAITLFSTTYSQVTYDELLYGVVRIPVSWQVYNRPERSNLVFEQVFPAGSTTNIELPREVEWVSSSGEGIVAPGYPGDDASQIVIQLRVVNQSNNLTLATQQIAIPIVESTALPITLEPYPTPTVEDTAYVLEQSEANCQLELLYTGSHTTMLVYAEPFDPFDSAIGSLTGSCREADCQWALPVTGRLAESDMWYRVIYEAEPAWVDIRDDARFVGSCDTIPTVEPVEGTATPMPLEPHPTPTTVRIFENCFQEPFPPVNNLTSGQDVVYNYPPFETSSPLLNEMYRTLTGTEVTHSLVGSDPIVTLLDVACFQSAGSESPMRRWYVQAQDGAEGWMDEYFQIAEGEYWYLLRDSYPPGATVSRFALSATTINQDDTVIVEWEVANTDHVAIQVMSAIGGAAITENGDNLPPSGSATITAPLAAINSIEMVYPPGLADPIRLNVNCAYSYIDTTVTDRAYCPQTPETATLIFQSFENGYMILLPSGLIAAISNTTGFKRTRQSTRRIDFSLDVPAGMHAPAIQFASFWLADVDIQSNLGWATAPSESYTAQVQQVYGSMDGSYRTTYFSLPDGSFGFVSEDS